LEYIDFGKKKELEVYGVI